MVDGPDLSVFLLPAGFQDTIASAIRDGGIPPKIVFTGKGWELEPAVEETKPKSKKAKK